MRVLLAVLLLVFLAALIDSLWRTHKGDEKAAWISGVLAFVTLIAMAGVVTSIG